MSQKKRSQPFTIIKNYRYNPQFSSKKKQSIQNEKSNNKITISSIILEQTGTKSQQFTIQQQMIDLIEPESILEVQVNQNKYMDHQFVKHKFSQRDDLQMAIPYQGNAEQLDQQSPFSKKKKIKVEQNTKNTGKGDAQGFISNDDFTF